MLLLIESHMKLNSISYYIIHKNFSIFRQITKMYSVVRDYPFYAWKSWAEENTWIIQMKTTFSFNIKIGLCHCTWNTSFKCPSRDLLRVSILLRWFQVTLWHISCNISAITSWILVGHNHKRNPWDFQCIFCKYRKKFIKKLSETKFFLT